MSTFPEDKLDRMVDRWEAIQRELNAGPNQATYAALTKEFASLDPIVATINELRQTRREIADLEAMRADPAADREMSALADEELSALAPRLEEIAQRLQIQLLPKDAADERSAILEVRAGTGGDEAALFAADLFRMYSRYADLHGWRTEFI